MTRRAEKSRGQEKVTTAKVWLRMVSEDCWKYMELNKRVERYKDTHIHRWTCDFNDLWLDINISRCHLAAVQRQGMLVCVCVCVSDPMYAFYNTFTPALFSSAELNLS